MIPDDDDDEEDERETGVGTAACKLYVFPAADGAEDQSFGTDGFPYERPLPFRFNVGMKLFAAADVPK